MYIEKILLTYVGKIYLLFYLYKKINRNIMLNKIIYIFLISILQINIIFAYPLLSVNNIDSCLQSFVKEKSLTGASFSVFAIDLNSNDTIAKINQNLSLIPASVTKLVTTSAALEVLGKDFKFETTIKYSGKIVDSILIGNIYIIGGGDPALGSSLFKDTYFKPNFLNVWAKEIQKLGIKKIEGSIIPDDSYFDKYSIPSTWIWGDMGNYFGAFPSGLTIYDNTYSIYINSGKNSGDTTYINNIEPENLNIVFDNRLRASPVNKDKSNIFGAPYSNLRYITGTIPKNKINYKVKGSIPNPPFYVASELNKHLEEIGVYCEKGIKMEKNEIGDVRNKICSTKSPQLQEIIHWTNMKSINLYAEHLCNQIGKTTNGTNNYIGGTKAIVDFWKSKNINTKGVYLNDGSGLSRYNVLTTSFLVGILQYMKKSENYETLIKSLPIAGRTGSLWKMCKGTFAENNLHAKSGYLTRVRSYAGYTKTKSGKEIAFAVIVNNYSCSASKMKNILEELMVNLADF